ncbi:MAG: SCO1664 family protein [Nocardioidaceae bacterium]
MGSSALPSEDPSVLDSAAVERVLGQGELDIEGRLVAASNASFFGHVVLDGISLPCIYKPVAGERPLWDFPDGTLAARERAAWLVSEAAGWHLVPPTVLREGRFGAGMCQRWIEAADPNALVDVVAAEAPAPGWLAVLEAEDQAGDPVLLVHADDPKLRSMAVLDAIINNADRKGGHLLLESRGGGLFGCDHGVSFHEEDKLRTVLWGWAGDPLRDEDRVRLEHLGEGLEAGLGAVLGELLTRAEVSALARRVKRLRRADRMPSPGGSWRVIPWPAF